MSGFFACPECGRRTVARGGFTSAAGKYIRYRVCKCGAGIRTIADSVEAIETILVGRGPMKSRGCDGCRHLATCRGLAPDEPVKCETLLPWETAEWDNDVDNRPGAISAESVMWLRAA